MPAGGFGKDLRPKFAFSAALENFLKFNARFEFFSGGLSPGLKFSPGLAYHTFVSEKELSPLGARSRRMCGYRPMTAMSSFHVTPFLVASIFTVACSFPTPPPP